MREVWATRLIFIRTCANPRLVGVLRNESFILSTISQQKLIAVLQYWQCGKRDLRPITLVIGELMFLLRNTQLTNVVSFFSGEFRMSV